MKEFYSIQEVAERWGVSRHTVTAAIRSGRLQAFKVNLRQYRIRGEDLERYEHQQQTQQEAPRA